MFYRRSSRPVFRSGGQPVRSGLWEAERGQASLLLLGLVAALLCGLLVLFAFGQALGAKGRHQRAADLAAVSAAQVMRNHYGRLFEPPVLLDGAPNPRHLSKVKPKRRRSGKANGPRISDGRRRAVQSRTDETIKTAA